MTLINVTCYICTCTNNKTYYDATFITPACLFHNPIQRDINARLIWPMLNEPRYFYNSFVIMPQTQQSVKNTLPARLD